MVLSSEKKQKSLKKKIKSRLHLISSEILAVLEFIICENKEFQLIDSSYQEIVYKTEIILSSCYKDVIQRLG